ncbi:hypothetical protein N8987_06720 [Crocinitomix sp.]|nr:hypothetical protein [Crocinitomix sp.]
MKLILLLCFASVSFISIAQEKNKPEGYKVGGAQTNARSFAIKKAPDKIKDANISGKYIIERYSIQIKTTETKRALSAVGTELEISDSLIVGNEIKAIEYHISESQLMNTEDYLYRVFGEVPEELPADLPLELMVHRTNNLDCYGIAELPDGVLLIPYSGLLFYAREF